jgi:hypothetical protein
MSDPTPVVATPKTKEELKVISSQLKKGEDIINIDQIDINQLIDDGVIEILKLGNAGNVFQVPTHWYYIFVDGTMTNLNCEQEQTESAFRKSIGSMESKQINKDKQSNCKINSTISEAMQKYMNEKTQNPGHGPKLTYTDIEKMEILEVKKEGLMDKTKSWFSSLRKTGGRKSRKSRKQRKQRKSRKTRQ